MELIQVTRSITNDCLEKLYSNVLAHSLCPFPNSSTSANLSLISGWQGLLLLVYARLARSPNPRGSRRHHLATGASPRQIRVPVSYLGSSRICGLPDRQ